MTTLLGLGVGVGLALVWLALTDTGERRPRAPRPAVGRGADELLRRAGVEDVSPVALASMSGVGFAVVAVLMLGVSRTLPVALVFAAMAAWLPVAVLRGRAQRRARELAECWPEAVDNLASAVRAGLSLPEALGQLGERGPEPLRDAFARFGRDYQASGRFAESLDSLKVRLADPVGDRVVEALRIARDVGGGDLGRMLRALSGFLRDDARTRGELESRQAWTVNGARLAVAAPWVVLLMMSFQRDVVTRFASGSGLAVLVGGAVVCVVAYRLMMRIGRLPAERRILA
ncbi:type II secretion system F family protein [Solicola sp. PLA-1-18]|uniref:type II secretion system F family protein n=1 Tax=Solicola sp. PLA-1-18 TaxID=3380532 RepID=UPI003B7F6E57